MKLFYSLILIFHWLTFCPAKNHSEKIIYYKLGSTTLPIKVTQFGSNNKLVFINLHANETTSLQTAKGFLSDKEGLLIEIINPGKRYISFVYKGFHYSFDPNGIFTEAGIIKTLKQQGKYNTGAAKEVSLFADRIHQMIGDSVNCIVALHNNTKDGYSILTYTKGNEKENDALKVNVNPNESPDNFFYTTQQTFFNKLSIANYNMVLQDNAHCTDDGSLSVYCGKNNIRYINCETEHGDNEKYLQMFTILYEMLTCVASLH